MATRSISLTEPLDDFIEDRVRSGDYQNASEVVRAGLRLLKTRADRDAQKLERLKVSVQVGLDELDRGEGEKVEWDNLGDWLAERGRQGDA